MHSTTYRNFSRNLQQFSTEVSADAKARAIESMASIISNMKTEKINSILDGSFILDVEPFKSIVVFDEKHKQLGQLTKRIKSEKKSQRQRRKMKRTELKRKDELLKLSESINLAMIDWLKETNSETLIGCQKIDSERMFVITGISD